MKFIKKYYLLLLLIITLAGVSIYGTYAMFTSEIGIDAFKLEASSLPVDQEIMEYEKVVIGANDAKTIALNVSNSTNQTLHYGAWYQMISPNTINDDITIAKLTDSPDETSGTIDGNSNKNVYIYVGNNTSSEITLYVGIKYSETSSLELPDNRTLITNTRDGKYIVGVTVTNGTVENGVTLTNLITNGSFEDGSNGWSLSNASVTNTQHSDGSSSLMLNTNTTAMSTQTLSESAPTINHQYYGKLNFLSNNNFTTVGARYEWIFNDNPGALMTFANKDISTTDWKIMSEILSINTPTYLSENWYLRNFVVDANAISYVDDLVLVDLTDSYESSYPSKEILDRSIRYFDGIVSYNYQKLNKGNVAIFKVMPKNNAKIENVTCTNSDVNYSNNTLTISNITGDVQCNVKFKESITVAELVQQMNVFAKNDVPDFGNEAITDEGIYKAQDDYGTSYYYRGAVENNYVQFAGFYWRIIRSNGDGSIRLIYDGTTTHVNGESSTDRYIGKSRYNSTYGDNAFVGYMSGIDNECSAASFCQGSTRTTSYNQASTNLYNSIIKIAVDNWYKTNIVDKGYSDKVADVIYCNDRSLFNGIGYGRNDTYYNVYNRLDANKSPILTCPQKNDAFTVDDTIKGNGALTYPVGLITADEVAMAGAVYLKSNSSYYLFTGEYFWTMSPNRFTDINACVFLSDSNLSYVVVSYIFKNDSLGIRPVLSLKPDVMLQGDGTIEYPFTVI